MSNKDDDVCSLIDQLELGNLPKVTPSRTETPSTSAINPDHDDIDIFISQSAQQLIKNGIESAEQIRDMAIASGDPEMVLAHSHILAATSKAIETLNKHALLKKKIKGAMKIEQMKIDAKKDNTPSLSGAQYLFQSTREDVFKRLLESQGGDTIIDSLAEK